MITKRLVLVLILAGMTGTLSACGTQPVDRGLSGAGMGATAGIVAGPIGVGTGALVGGGIGLLTSSNDIYLGKPVWR